MRIALCLSGMVRTLMQTYPSIQRNLLNPLSPDVFIHTYDRMGLRKENDLPVSESWLKAMFSPVDCRIVPQAQADLVHEQERDRLYCYPGPIFGGGIDPEVTWRLKNVLSQLWHVQQCDTMRRSHERKQGFKYDVVVRARMDNVFKGPLQVRENSQPFPENTVFYPEHSGYGGLCDQFAMGNSDSMAVHSDYYLHFEKVFRSRPLVPARWGAPEGLLRRYIEVFTDIKPVTFSFPFDLQRENEVETISHKTDAWWRVWVLGESDRRVA